MKEVKLYCCEKLPTIDDLEKCIEVKNNTNYRVALIYNYARYRATRYIIFNDEINKPEDLKGYINDLDYNWIFKKKEN